MASEEISHAIFASSHPAPLSTASSSTPPPTPRFAPHLAPRFAPHLALHFAPHLALHSHPASRLSCTPHPAPHHALHPAPRPPFPSLSLSQVSSSSHRQVPPSTSLHLPPVRQFPICVSPPSVSLCQAPSPCAPTPFPTAHFHRTSLLPRIPLAKSLHPSHSIFLPSANFPPIRVSPPSVSLSQAPPADFLVRKKARLTHDMTFFHHDVRRKRFSAHEESHNMEMIISKDHVAEKPRRGWNLWRHGRP